MSRATTMGPVSETMVATGCFDSSARISFIGRSRSIATCAACRARVEQEELRPEVLRGAGRGAEVIVLGSYGTLGMPTATVRLRGPDQVIHNFASMGTGPVDATYKAIDAIIKTPCKLLEFNIHAVTEGIDALGEVTVKVEEQGKKVAGHGADTDIIVASAKAYINALNKLIVAQTEGLNPTPANQMHGVMLG